MAGRDPERGGGHQADGGDTARFHRELSSFSGVALALGFVLAFAAAQHVAGDIHKDRQHGLRVEIGLERAAPPHAVGDDHQHGDDAVEVDVAGDVAARGGGAHQVEQPLAHVGIERRRDAGDLRIAARLRHHLGAQQHLLVRPHGEVVVRHALEHGEEAVREVGAGELLRHLGAVALGDAGDQRLLRGEVAVEVARAHAGLGADVLHRGAVKPRAHEAALRGRQNLGAAVGLELGVRPAHGGISPVPLRCRIAKL